MNVCLYPTFPNLCTVPAGQADIITASYEFAWVTSCCGSGSGVTCGPTTVLVEGETPFPQTPPAPFNQPNLSPTPPFCPAP